MKAVEGIFGAAGIVENPDHKASTPAKALRADVNPGLGDRPAPGVVLNSQNRGIAELPVQGLNQALKGGF